MRYVFLLFAILVTVGTYLLPADGADLRIPLPKPRPTAIVEQCLGPGVTPAMRQTLQPDETCPTKLRWKNPGK